MDKITVENIKSKVMRHQRESLEVIEEYLESNVLDKHALVKMPTGTGKTGIIAIVSNAYDKYKNILIVTPNAVLPKQVREEIESLFWKKIGLSVEKIELKPISLYENGIMKNINTSKLGTVLIITLQKLNDLFKGDREEYEKIKDNIDLILFDEGHREPAKEWSKITRELCKKTILFTATPYRNDELSFKFHIDEYKYKYRYSFSDAVKDEVIKDVRISSFNDEILEDKSKLVDYILNLHEKKQNQKILVRCRGREEIEYLVTEINLKKGNIALGCHSEISLNAKEFIKKGIDIYDGSNEYYIFIHEDMLIEGFNDPQISTLIMCHSFNNSKSLVQQIGRIVRRDSNSKIGEVYVPESMKLDYLEQWERFKEYDKDPESGNIKYLNGRFMQNFILDKNFYKELVLPKASNIYISENSIFDLAKYYVKSELLNKASIRKLEEYEDDNIWILCYEKISFSSILKDKSYEEKTLECTLVREIKKNDDFYLFFYDTRGYSFPIDRIEERVYSASIDLLYNLFPKDTEFSNLKINSMSISNVGINSRTIEGQKIENLRTNINERLSYCKSVRGQISSSQQKKNNRYIGTTTARVNDYERVSLEEYLKWSENITEELNLKKNNNFFERFSKIYSGNIDELKATSVLIDLSELLLKSENTEIVDIQCINSGKSIIDNIKSISCDVNCDKFYFDFDSKTIDGQIYLDNTNKKKNYKLNIPEFKNYQIISKDGRRLLLLDYINKRNFKIYFSLDGVIYSEDIFFKPDLNFRNCKLDDLDIGKRIIAVDGLEKCVEEKFGSRPVLDVDYLNDWQEDSIFGFLVDQIKNKKGVFKDEYFTALVCDDLQTEIADFIAIDEIKNRIVLIHCKNSSSALSASAFQDVCGQAEKNVSYIIKNNLDVLQDIEKHIDNWNGKWSDSKTYNPKENKLKVKVERDRMVFGGLTGKGFWDKYTQIIKSVNATVEVWLFTNGLRRSKLARELELPNSTKKKQKEEVNQLMWILYGTQEVLAEVGAILKIYCCK